MLAYYDPMSKIIAWMSYEILNLHFKIHFGDGSITTALGSKGKSKWYPPSLAEWLLKNLENLEKKCGSYIQNVDLI